MATNNTLPKVVKELTTPQSVALEIIKIVYRPGTSPDEMDAVVTRLQNLVLNAK